MSADNPNDSTNKSEINASSLSGGPVNSATAGTTTFVVSEEAVAVQPDISPVDPMADLDVESEQITEIRDFLRKPIPVANGSFSTASTWGDQLYSADLYTLFDAQSIWKNKIQGFLNVRGTVKLRFTLNSTPFQAGLLRLSYFPCANQLVNEKNAHKFNRDTISQLRGGYIDLGQDALLVDVPYLSPVQFIERDLVAGGGHVSWGEVMLHVFEILRTGSSGPNNATWTLWMSVEDLQLSGQIQPQALGKRGTITDQETNSGRGPIATIMGSAKSLASSMAAIPSLNPLAKPAAWALAAAEAAADALGWSKPTLDDGPTPMGMGTTWYNINTNTNDNCLPLGLRSDNKLSVITDASPSGQDEMSFAYIKSRWAYDRDFQWNSAHASGALLASFRVGPSWLKKGHTVGSTPVVTSPPCAVFSEFFQLYRGSFDYNFKFVKTGFHTGECVICWLPGLSPVAPLSYMDTAFTYRVAFNLQSGTDICLNLPHMIPQQYLDCGNDLLGTVYIYVVNPLRAPETCAPIIDVMAEVRGGPDLTYAVPKGFGAVPFVPQALGPGKHAPTMSEFQATSRYILEVTENVLICAGTRANVRRLREILSTSDAQFVIGVAESILPSGKVAEKDEFFSVGEDLFLYFVAGIDESVRDFYVDYFNDQVSNLPDHPTPAAVPGVFEPQAITVDEEGLVECKTMGAVTHDQLTAHHAQLSVGEMMNSFTELLKADYNILFGTFTLVPPTSVATHKFYGARYNTSGAPVLTWPEMGADPTSFVASWFVFHRGAIRWRFSVVQNQYVSLTGGTGTGGSTSLRALLLTQTDSPAYTIYQPVGATSWKSVLNGQKGGNVSNTYRMTQLPSANGTLPVQAPFYCKYRYGLNHLAVASLDGNQTYVNNQSVAINYSSAYTGQVNFSRCIGDDFQFSYWTGIPVYANAAFFFT